jgi:hypothetical protein
MPNLISVWIAGGRKDVQVDLYAKVRRAVMVENQSDPRLTAGFWLRNPVITILFASRLDLILSFDDFTFLGDGQKIAIFE